MAQNLVATQIHVGLSGDYCDFAPSIEAAEKQSPKPLFGKFVRRGD